MKITEYGNNKKPRKMTQIEQIKAEIERLKHYGTIPYDRDVFEGVCLIESFINSLPAEQPSEDLEEEISNYIKENFFGSDSMGLLSNRTNGELDCIDVVNIARYFANWQKEQMMKSAVDATCVLLPPPDVFKVLICHEVTDKLTVGQKVKVIFMEDKQCSTE